jgi:hypothetical protein
MKTVLRRIDQGEAHVAQLHIWQKGNYILSLAREVREILSTAVQIAEDQQQVPGGRENESAEEGNV